VDSSEKSGATSPTQGEVDETLVAMVGAGSVYERRRQRTGGGGARQGEKYL
jgi:hypothetical protein